MMNLYRYNIGDNSLVPPALQAFSGFLRLHHLPDLVAEEVRLTAPGGETGAANRVANLDRFLARLEAGQDVEPGLSPAQVALHQQAMLAYLDRYSHEPPVILAITRALADQVARVLAAGPSAPPDSTLTHDLRGALNALSGALQVLETALDGPSRERGERMLAIAVRNTERMADLVDGWAAGARSV